MTPASSLVERLKELEARATPGRVHEGFADVIAPVLSAVLKPVKYNVTHVCASENGRVLAFVVDKDTALLWAELNNALPQILEALESTDSSMTAYWKREAERRADWRPLVQPEVEAATKVLKERAEAAEQRVAELEREAGYAIDLLREIKHDLHMRAELNEDRDSDTGAIVLALSSGLVRRLNDTINPPASRTEGRK